jgi:hypothetical protein
MKLINKTCYDLGTIQEAMLPNEFSITFQGYKMVLCVYYHN